MRRQSLSRPTEAVRRAIQHSQESLRALAKRHGVNRRRSPNGRGGSQFLIFGPDRRSPDRQSCQQRKRPSSLHARRRAAGRAFTAPGRRQVSSFHREVDFPTPGELAAWEIPRIVSYFAAATRRAREAGFDGGVACCERLPTKIGTRVAMRRSQGLSKLQFAARAGHRPSGLKSKAKSV
jgi:hypothetical protein